MQRSTMQLLGALTLALAPTAAAQRLLVTQQNPPRVHRVDVTAGAVFEYDWLAPAGVNAPILDAAVVGSQLWVAIGAEGIRRFDLATLAPLGGVQINTPQQVRSIQPVAGGAWAVRSERVLEHFDLSGNLLATAPAPGALDVFEYAGELLVVDGVFHSVERYDLNGQHIGSLTAPGLGVGADLLGFGQLSVRPSNGNLLLVAAFRLYELDPATGVVIAEHQAGNLELAAHELADGRILTLTASGAVIYDPRTPSSPGSPIPTTATRFFENIAPFDAGAPGFARFCPGAVNSTGVGARIAARGTTHVASASLWLDAFDAPAGSLGMFVYGQPGSAFPYGSGQLCLSPLAPGIARTATIGAFDAAGRRLSVELPYASLPAHAPILAGSTWAFQCVYRDIAAAGPTFNVTDAIQLAFD